MKNVNFTVPCSPKLCIQQDCHSIFLYGLFIEFIYIVYTYIVISIVYIYYIYSLILYIACSLRADGRVTITYILHLIDVCG